MRRALILSQSSSLPLFRPWGPVVPGLLTPHTRKAPDLRQGLVKKKGWRLPTLPRSSRSTIGAWALYFRVRNGIGCCVPALATSLLNVGEIGEA